MNIRSTRIRFAYVYKGRAFVCALCAAAASYPRAGGGSRRRNSCCQLLSPVACVYWRNDMRVVWCFHTIGAPVLAAYRTPAGRWAVVAPGCRDLSGRTGVRRIAVLDEPAGGGGGGRKRGERGPG